jgi:hypothetical protein
MLARSISVRLRPNKAREFVSILETEIIPLLRRQKGFRAYITFVAQDGTEAVGITLWEQLADIEVYERASLLQVMLALAKIIDGSPQVQTYDISDRVYQLIRTLKALTDPVEKVPQFEVYEVSRKVIEKIAGGLSARGRRIYSASGMEK